MLPERAPPPCSIIVPQSILDAPQRPPPLDYDGLRGRAVLDSAQIEALTPAERAAREASWAGLVERLQGLALDRDAEWEAAFTAAETQPDTLIGLAADANRCGREARR
jgi:hypothetical protein